MLALLSKCKFSAWSITQNALRFFISFFHNPTTSIAKALKIQGIKKHGFGYN